MPYPYSVSKMVNPLQSPVGARNPQEDKEKDPRIAAVKRRMSMSKRRAM